MRRRSLWIGLGVALLALGLAPWCLSSYLLSLLTQALIYAILAMSLDLLLGYTGLPSLGHAAYFGVGAYSVGILTIPHGANF
jgi:branched-chain amino acid transport system permease protein